MTDSILALNQVTKHFGTVEALKGISLDVKKGEFLTLLGPSGCGKTTTLRIIAGLEVPDSGTVLLQGKNVTFWEPNKRNVNTVFQNYALFPHMDVFHNIAYGLKLKKEKKPIIKQKVQEILDLVQLSGYEKRMPAHLSGGQKQRVAIARALVNNPDILLLDEPLGALDLQLRRQMQVELKKLQQHLGITFIYITHDQEEALNMSDRVGIMNAGALEQLGTPDDVYERPATPFAARFIGLSNIFDSVVEGKDSSGNLILSYAGGTIKAQGEASVGDILTLSVRTERVLYGQEDRFGFSLQGVVKSHHYTGGLLRTVLQLGNGEELTVSGMGGGDNRIPTGTRVSIQWDPACSVIVERRRRP